VLVVADTLPHELVPGERLDIDVHVVSDLRETLDFAVVDAVMSWRGGEQRWRFGGPISADDVAKVGRIRLDVPNADGPIVLELQLTSGDRSSHNRYHSTISPQAGSAR
jgi:hypothetical protein